MNILLVAINAKYIHSNLAVFSLRRHGTAHSASDIDIAEYTINQPLERILADIMKRDPDVLFLSCYIWNISHVRNLVSDISKIRPDMDIWLGGPEVSMDAELALSQMPGAKGMIRGEGERAFSELVKKYESESSGFFDICDITYRDNAGSIITNPSGSRMDLNEIEFPYENLSSFDNRIIYYESSRGCPFRCSYCLSSVDKSPSFRSIDKVRTELQFFIDRKVPQVKFIDRTFNCDHRRAAEIWRYIADNDNGITNFHFEIAADILTEEELELLSGMRPGLVQLEIGVQTTNEKTLREIRRPMDFSAVCENVSRILSRGNVHVHLDLIAGLPYENAISFRKSFNDVFALRPHQLQLGFLKVLKGSPMEQNCREYGLLHTDAAPYEVLKTAWISYAELSALKSAERMLDAYYNSGQFAKSLEFLLQSDAACDAFGIFEKLAAWYEERGLDRFRMSRNSLYENFLNFGMELLHEDGDRKAFRDTLVFDYYARDNVKSRPSFLGEATVDRDFMKAFYSGSRTARNMTHLEMIDGRLLLFDYSQRDPVTGNVPAYCLTVSTMRP